MYSVDVLIFMFCVYVMFGRIKRMLVPEKLLVIVRKLRYVSVSVMAFCECVYMLFGRIKRVLVLEMKCHKLVVR